MFLLKWGSFGVGDGQFQTPLGVAVDASGSVYVTDPDNHRIQKFTATGTFLTKWGTLGNGDGQFNEPLGVAVDVRGDVYVAELNNLESTEFLNVPQVKRLSCEVDSLGSG